MLQNHFGLAATMGYLYNEGMEPHEKVTEVLRRAILDSGINLSTIAYAADLAPAIPTAFVRGKRGLTGKSIDRLCEVLKLRLVPTGEPHGLVDSPRGRKPARQGERPLNPYDDDSSVTKYGL